MLERLRPRLRLEGSRLTFTHTSLPTLVENASKPVYVGGGICHAPHVLLPTLVENASKSIAMHP